MRIACRNPGADLERRAMSSPRAAVLVAAGLIGLVACTSSHRTTTPHDYVPREVVELARWDVRDGSRVLGAVVQLEIRDPAAPIRYYRVVDRNGHWVGHATEQGRFSRRAPFREDEEDLGLWPMAQGVGRLFGLDRAVQLREAATAAPASAEKRPSR